MGAALHSTHRVDIIVRVGMAHVRGEASRRITYGAAPTALKITIVDTQPFRAGLTFGGRPSGPRQRAIPSLPGLGWSKDKQRISKEEAIQNEKACLPSPKSALRITSSSTFRPSLHNRATETTSQRRATKSSLDDADMGAVNKAGFAR